MARPVVPVRVRGRVVRVDVARTSVGTIVHVATAANGTNHVGINEVGVKEHFTKCTVIPFAEDYSTADFLPLVFGRKFRIAYGVFVEM